MCRTKPNETESVPSNQLRTCPSIAVARRLFPRRVKLITQLRKSALLLPAPPAAPPAWHGAKAFVPNLLPAALCRKLTDDDVKLHASCGCFFSTRYWMSFRVLKVEI